MFKKATIAVLGLAASIATAGSMGPVCTPGNVTVPCATNLWDFGAQALYLRSVYGAEKAFQFGTAPLNKELKNDWNWGYFLEGSYHFNTRNDITINWMHFSTSAGPTELFGSLTIPAANVPLIPAPFEFINRNRIDQVNVVMGQHTDFSIRKKIRFYAGLQYANIQSTGDNYYITSIVPSLASNPFSKFDNTDYKGIGPVAGINYAYYITDSLSVTANGGGSILYGTNRYHAGFVFTPLHAIVEQVSLRKNAIVPSLEAKLGVNYAHATPIGLANIQVGYQVVNYFHVLEEQILPNLFGPVRAVDYGVYGPYFGLKLISNA